jgi:hypothetical protein
MQTDSLRKFYSSLRAQRPDSQMARKWCDFPLPLSATRCCLLLHPAAPRQSVPQAATHCLLLQCTRVLVVPTERPPAKLTRLVLLARSSNMYV